MELQRKQTNPRYSWILQHFFVIIDRTRQKISKDIEELNTINQQNLTVIEHATTKQKNTHYFQVLRNVYQYRPYPELQNKPKTNLKEQKPYRE